MTARANSLPARAAIAVLCIAAAACGSNAANTTSNAGNAEAAKADNATANAAAPATPTPAAPALSPPTGPLAIASDSGLPAQCKSYLAEAQACMDSIPGPADGMNTHMLRSTINNDRTTWARETSAEWLAKGCTRAHDSLRELARTRYNCRLN